MPSRHAILGPSGAHRWLTCTPSARFEEQLPNEESIYAREGTIAHEIAALVLGSRCGHFRAPQKEFNDQMEHWQAVAVEFYEAIEAADPWAEYLAMLDYAEQWAAYVQDYVQMSYKSQLFIEREYDLSQFVPLGFGTSDATVKLPEVLHVFDYKFGAGKQVYADQNEQCMLYALGALIALVKEDPTYKPHTVCIHIVQPRSGDGIPSSWQISVAELLEWAEFTVAPAAALAISGQGEFVAGPHCQFCNAKTLCRAWYLEFADVLRITDKRTISEKDRAIVLDRGDAVAAFVKSMKEQAIADMQAGKRVAGFKLVAGKGRRQFTNENDVVDVLLGTELYDGIFDAKMRSLTDIEKRLGKKRFAELFTNLVITKEGAPVLADETDKRPAIGLNAHDEYLDDDPDYEDLT